MAIWVCHSHLLLLRRLSLPLPALKASKCSAAASTRHAGHSHCYYRRSRLPFARPQRPKPLRGSFDQALRPHPSATIGVRGCRLPALKGLKPSAAASTGSFDRQLRPGHSGHSHLLLSGFEAAVCPPSKA